MKLKLDTEILKALEKLKKELEDERERTSLNATQFENLYNEFTEYGATQFEEIIEKTRVSKCIANEKMLVAKKNAEWLPYLHVSLPKNFALNVSKVICEYLPWLYYNHEDRCGKPIYILESEYLLAHRAANNVLWEKWKQEYAKIQGDVVKSGQITETATSTALVVYNEANKKIKT